MDGRMNEERERGGGRRSKRGDRRDSLTDCWHRQTSSPLVPAGRISLVGASRNLWLRKRLVLNLIHSPPPAADGGTSPARCFKDKTRSVFHTFPCWTLLGQRAALSVLRETSYPLARVCSFEMVLAWRTQIRQPSWPIKQIALFF